MPKDTFEIDQPWVTYHYPFTDVECDQRGLFALVNMVCAVCGRYEEWKVGHGQEHRIEKDSRGYAMERVKFLEAHKHPDRGHPMSWAQPLRNPAVHTGGIDGDLLAMRLQADLNASETITEKDDNE